MKLVGIASLLAGMTFAGGAEAATNLLANGSFETGNFAGWTQGGLVLDPYPAVVIDYGSASSYPTGAFGEAVPPDNSASLSPDPAGDQAAYFVSDLALETLSQTVFLAPGKYNIGFSAYAPANGFANAGEALFSGVVAGVPLAAYAVSSGPVTTWQHYTGVLNVAAAGNYVTTFTFGAFGAPSKDLVLDRVYITSAIPEPATWGMMITGLGLAGVALRRRRQTLTPARSCTP